MTTLSDIGITQAPLAEARPSLGPSRGVRVFPVVHPGTRGHPNQPGLWPAKWISASDGRPAPVVAAYRLVFSLAVPTELTVHLTADERYEFFVDGQSVAQGPERGDAENWFFESYRLNLLPGPHVFVARVWSAGEKAPFAQLSLDHGFLLCPDDPAHIPLFATGQAPWQGKVLSGYDWQPPVSCAWGTGWNQIINASEFAWGHEEGAGNDWQEVMMKAFGDSAEGVRNVSLHVTSMPHHRLRPGWLPPMSDEVRSIGEVRHVAEFFNRPAGLHPVRHADHLTNEAEAWQALSDGTGPLVLPPFTKRRIIFDLQTYLCGRPALTVTGGVGASIEVAWTEGLYEHIDHPPDCECIEAEVWPKGNRDEIEGKYFLCPWFHQDGPGDTFRLGGGPNRTLSPLWWQAGRYVQVLVETAADPLHIESLTCRETRYPLETEGEFFCSDPQLIALQPLMIRSMQACAHETFMDCPFYEQLMYAGDTRLEMLVTYVLTEDDRLPRKALKLFDWSRLLSGLTQSRYPARVRQIIPPFSLWWIASCHDYALWRGDKAFVKSLLPGVRAVCDHFAGLIGDDGLLLAPDGWNFTDWVDAWPNGVPPAGNTGHSAILNWQAASSFRQAAELEKWFGEPELAALQSRRAAGVAAAAHEHFWNEGRGLYADEITHQHWSEHAQCLALLSGLMPSSASDRLAMEFPRAKNLTPVSFYFSHYLFEAYRTLKRADLIFERMAPWQAMLDLGLKTTLEKPEPSRSDCHAWSAHPLFHYYATFAGIRPTAPGFTEMNVDPQLGSLDWLEARIPHPRGPIEISVREGCLSVQTPEGVVWKNQPVATQPTAVLVA